MSLNIKGLKEFIKDLPDEMEVTIESIISGDENYCSETVDIYIHQLMIIAETKC
ncbi:hypothetical protein [Clostridium butyricum]|mgnify:CR=1 FL=1|uniref:hypothetical protein n=1 Tax=Clostridium butyricum TaxID=1492 RepID=UPI000A96FE26|nr:hypothetical protein [Clostridium butyricum]MCI3010235.1 hypothetical protein [Clostridium butyricum]MDM8131458.1 hypothetical protein [Clostridium butyricum]MDM8227939.1 hypothetical protein [Clostridium butyricum]MDP0842231.1 hypothetical protein [Clostridium butyricum]WLS70241.1 hypothetical protein Q9978_18510 [Clostridium butyricum]